MAMTPKDECKWVYDEDYDVWDTECGNGFCLTDGTLRDNKMKFCPYCGKKIKEKKLKK